MSKRGTIGVRTRRLVYNMFGGRCAYCGCEIDFDELECDHIIPFSEGGRTINNLFPACKICNNAKGTKSIEEFRKYLMGKAFLKPGVSLILRYYDIEPKFIDFYFEEVGFDIDDMLKRRIV